MLKTERQLQSWIARHGGIKGWQPTSGKGGRPTTEWCDGIPPSGTVAYVLASDGRTASVCLDSATSPLGDAASDLSNALGAQQALIHSFLVTQKQLLDMVGQQQVQLAGLAHAVGQTVERLTNASAVALPGELAKGIATGITELGRMFAPLLVKGRTDSNG